MSPVTAKATMAKAYDRSGEARPETRIVPAMAVPSDEPRFDTLRDRPEISPWSSSGKLDCTTLTDGVSITPTLRPVRAREAADELGEGERDEHPSQ